MIPTWVVIGLSAAALISPMTPPGTRAESAHNIETATPSDVIRRLCEQILSTMKDGASLGGEGRFQRLEPIVTRTFDLPLMTQIAVGPQWTELGPEQQERLIDAFTRFTVANYARHFHRFDGEQFEVSADLQKTSAGFLVPSRLVPRDGKLVELTYVMRLVDRRWKAVDVLTNGSISGLARHRSEFTSVLRREGVEALAARLEEKAETMLREPA
jgi:phospholipid transport system substrate-binding protein